MSNDLVAIVQSLTAALQGQLEQFRLEFAHSKRISALDFAIQHSIPNFNFKYQTDNGGFMSSATFIVQCLHDLRIHGNTKVSNKFTVDGDMVKFQERILAQLKAMTGLRYTVALKDDDLIITLNA